MKVTATAMPLYYLAYGSNLHPGRLRRRIFSCRAEGTVSLPGHALRFQKRGRDSSGKADLLHTGFEGDYAYGVVYRIDRLAKPALDACEQGYRTVHLDLVVAGKERRVFTYQAEPTTIDAELLPFSWYKGLVVAGARYHGFPAAYLDRLLAVAEEADPDPDRQQLHSALLAGLTSLASPPLP